MGHGVQQYFKDCYPVRYERFKRIFSFQNQQQQQQKKKTLRILYTAKSKAFLS